MSRAQAATYVPARSSLLGAGGIPIVMMTRYLKQELPCQLVGGRSKGGQEGGSFRQSNEASNCRLELYGGGNSRRKDHDTNGNEESCWNRIY